MDEQKDRDELLLRYLDGELSLSESKEVEERLATDESWLAAAEQLRLATTAVQYYGIREQVAAVHRQYVQPLEVPRKLAAKVLSLKKAVKVAMAVAACLLLVLIGWQGYEIYHLSAEKLVQESYVPYNLSNTRGEPVPAPPIEVAYAAGDYKGAIALSKKARTLNDRERLLVGLSFLRREDYLPAISWLGRLARMPEGPYKQDAEYYLAITHLKNRDFDRAIELMERIVDQKDHLYHRQFSRTMIRQVQLLKWK